MLRQALHLITSSPTQHRESTTQRSKYKKSAQHAYKARSAARLEALPFQTNREVGCEALSSYSRTGFGSSANTATPQWLSSVKQPCDEGRGMRKSYKRPQRCHAASKRKARVRIHAHEARVTRLRGKSTFARHFGLAQAT